MLVKHYHTSSSRSKTKGGHVIVVFFKFSNLASKTRSVSVAKDF